MAMDIMANYFIQPSSTKCEVSKLSQWLSGRSFTDDQHSGTGSRAYSAADSSGSDSHRNSPFGHLDLHNGTGGIQQCWNVNARSFQPDASVSSHVFGAPLMQNPAVLQQHQSPSIREMGGRNSIMGQQQFHFVNEQDALNQTTTHTFTGMISQQNGGNNLRYNDHANMPTGLGPVDQFNDSQFASLGYSSLRGMNSADLDPLGLNGMCGQELVWTDPNSHVKRWQQYSGTLAWGDPDAKRNESIQHWKEFTDDDCVELLTRVDELSKKEPTLSQRGWGDLPTIQEHPMPTVASFPYQQARPQKQQHRISPDLPVHSCPSQSKLPFPPNSRQPCPWPDPQMQQFAFGAGDPRMLLSPNHQHVLSPPVAFF